MKNTTTSWTPFAAAAASGAFACGCLVTQLVTVPSWRRASTPEEAREAFRRTGPATGAILFPLDVASTVLLTKLAISRARNQQPGMASSAGAALCMSATVALLPAYFAQVNNRLLDQEQPAESVPVLLEGWSRWNWLRTGLALAATSLSIRSNAAASHA